MNIGILSVVSVLLIVNLLVAYHVTMYRVEVRRLLESMASDAPVKRDILVPGKGLFTTKKKRSAVIMDDRAAYLQEREENERMDD